MEQRAAIAETLRAAAEVVSLDDLDDGLLASVQRVAGAHGLLFYRFGERGVAGIAGNLVQAMPAYGPEHFASDPVQRALLQADLVPDVIIATQVSTLDRRALRRSVAWADFYAPWDMVHLMGLPLTSQPYGAPGMMGALVVRGASQPDFQPADIEAVSAVVPALQAAARRILRFEERSASLGAAEAVLAAADALPHLACDLRGRLRWTSEGAARLLWPQGRGPLPDALQAAAARLGSVALGDEPRFDLRYELALPEQSLRALLSLTRDRQGEALVAIALEPRALEGGPVLALAERRGLTPAEARVLSVLALGCSNREIARRLSVSIETVRTHVRRVLEKLGVRSRAEAARSARALQ